MIATDRSGMDVDVLAILLLDSWIEVLAAPKEYRSLQRPADPAVLLKLLDVWLARSDRVERGDEGEVTSQKLFQHRFDAAPARALRAAVAAWATPEVLSDEIKEAARAVLRSMGREKAREGVAWEDYDSTSTRRRPLDEGLVWSEGLDAVLPRT